MTDTTAPRYPDQGGFVSPDAVPELLPPGLAPEVATLLFVHAHPDDESIATGAAMARYAGLGARVELLTMTRGEMRTPAPSTSSSATTDSRPPSEPSTSTAPPAAAACT